jgi:hypothetical protein
MVLFYINYGELSTGFWIPAFAGMTGDAGMTGRAGMTGDAGMTPLLSFPT